MSNYVYNTVIDQAAVNSEMDDIATALTNSLAKDGQTVPTANLPMGGYKLTGLAAGSAAGNSLRYEQLFTTSAVALLGAMDWVKGADIASASTINLTTATGNGVHVTGTTAITAVTIGSGMWRLVVFDGILTLTHHATTNNLPGGANITTAAGDRALYWGDGTTAYCMAYIKASGKATVNPAVGDITGLGSNVATALAVAVGTDGAFVVKGGALGTPASGNLANCTGYPTILSASYDSGDLTITLAGAHSLTHSLGGVPKIFNLLAKCTSAGGDAGYAQNEVIVLATNGADGNLANVGVSMKITSTQIVLRVGAGTGNTFAYYPHASTGVINGLDSTKWALIVRAYA